MQIGEPRNRVNDFVSRGGPRKATPRGHASYAGFASRGEHRKPRRRLGKEEEGGTSNIERRTSNGRWERETRLSFLAFVVI